MLQKLRKLAIVIISVLIFTKCTTTSPDNLQKEQQLKNKAVFSIYKNIDSFYTGECTPPPFLENAKAPLEEVTSAYYQTLVNFLECDLMHSGLVQQLKEIKAAQ